MLKTKIQDYSAVTFLMTATSGNEKNNCINCIIHIEFTSNC